MASAWGNSWGSVWGNSWGATVAAPETPSPPPQSEGSNPFTVWTPLPHPWSWYPKPKEKPAPVPVAVTVPTFQLQLEFLEPTVEAHVKVTVQAEPIEVSRLAFQEPRACVACKVCVLPIVALGLDRRQTRNEQRRIATQFLIRAGADPDPELIAEFERQAALHERRETCSAT